MNRVKTALLAATFGLALAFTLGCSADESPSPRGSSKSACIKEGLQIAANTLDDVKKDCNASRSEVLSMLSDDFGSCDKASLDFSKSIGDIMSECDVEELPIVNLSSSGKGSGGSSSSKNNPSQQDAADTFTDTRDGKKYKFEVASTGKIWMAENLNYSKNSTVGWCYGTGKALGTQGANSSGCDDGYGRAYTYAQAIDKNSPQGLCPASWHIPSSTEWTGAGITGIYAGNYDDANGWKEREKVGFYWTSSGQFAMQILVTDGLVNVQSPTAVTDYFSVRCIADADLKFYCGTAEYNPIANFCFNKNIHARCGGKNYNPSEQFCVGTTVYDKCGGKEYDPLIKKCEGGLVVDIICPSETVKIGGQCWMKYNLNVETSTGSRCYNNQESNCDIYGRLYDWATAMALPSSCNSSSCASQIKSPHRGLCPVDYHIPTNDDWDKLINFGGGSSVAGRILKATSGWNSNGNGTDTYGFSALPGGYYNNGSFYSAGNGGHWWSSTEGNSDNAYYRYMFYTNENADRYNINKSYGYSVRCVKD